MKQLTYIALLLMGISLHAADPTRDLETLLKELRETRTAQQREKTAAREEFQRLEQLIAQRRATLDQRAKANSELAAQVMTVEQRLADENLKISKLRKAAGERAVALAVCLKELRSLLDISPFLRDDNLPVDVTHFWSQLMAIVDTATKAEIEERPIDLNGEKLQVDVLQLGNVTALWLTRDLQRGGIGFVVDGQLTWQEQPEKIRKQIALAIRMIRTEVPAEAVVLPVHVEAAK